MVAPVHHATAKKAADLGFVFTGTDPKSATYELHWPEFNRRLRGYDAKTLVEDMRALKMIVKEHKAIDDVTQGADFKFTIRKGKKTLVRGAERLNDAMIDALDLIATGKVKEIADDQPAPAPVAKPGKPAKAKPAKAAKRRAEDDEDGEEEEDGEDAAEDEEEEEESEGKSVVKRKYKSKYRPFKMTCGDTLAREIKDFIMEKNEDGDFRQNVKKLRAFAVVNGVWDARYATLNPGMQRMNIGNRLRNLVRQGTDVVWSLPPGWDA